MPWVDEGHGLEFRTYPRRIPDAMHALAVDGSPEAVSVLADYFEALDYRNVSEVLSKYPTHIGPVSEDWLRRYEAAYRIRRESMLKSIRSRELEDPEGRTEP